jgi:hypothetical protein
MAPAIQDLWMMLSGDRPRQTTQLEQLIKGYSEFFTFNPRELRLVEALRTLRMLHFSAWLPGVGTPTFRASLVQHAAGRPPRAARRCNLAEPPCNSLTIQRLLARPRSREKPGKQFNSDIFLSLLLCLSIKSVFHKPRNQGRPASRLSFPTTSAGFGINW